MLIQPCYRWREPLTTFSQHYSPFSAPSELRPQDLSGVLYRSRRELRQLLETVVQQLRLHFPSDSRSR